MKNIYIILILFVAFSSCKKGPQGDIGPLGDPGVDGKNGTSSTEKGPVGDQGAVGAKGTTGATGAVGSAGATNIVVSDWQTLTWELEEVVDRDAASLFKEGFFVAKIKNADLTAAVLNNNVVLTQIRYTDKAGVLRTEVIESGDFLANFNYLTYFFGYNVGLSIFKTKMLIYKPANEVNEIAEASEELKSVKIEIRTQILK